MEKLGTRVARGARYTINTVNTIDTANTFEVIYARLLFVTNCTTQEELAMLLEISQSSISDAKRRSSKSDIGRCGSIPDAWLITLFDKFGLNPDYVRYGRGMRYLRVRRRRRPI